MLEAVCGNRLRAVISRIIDIFWVVVIFLASELMIWGLSRPLSMINIQFLASTFGMISAFSIILLAFLCDERVERWYQKYMKSKVDFINAHLGLGFPIPLVMLDQSQLLDAKDIGCIIGNFVLTNMISWSTVYLTSVLVMILWSRYIAKRNIELDGVEVSQPLTAPPSRLPRLEFTYDINFRPSQTKALDTSGSSAIDISNRSSVIDPTYLVRETQLPQWLSAQGLYPIALSFGLALLIGAPVVATTGDTHILDACMLWFVWIGWVRMQRILKDSTILKSEPRMKNALITCMNPVLATTLLMIGYVHTKALAMTVDLSEVLRAFSRGNPLYAIWTASVTGNTLEKNRELYFGAGDAALAILEVGILIWGFKLFECRRQLWSAAGLMTAILSIAAAAVNVFLSVLLGRLMGLEKPEALAFAARSTTLALAKPAIEAVGGNLAVNAALVVSNGILGQLTYPFILDKMGVRREGKMESRSGVTRFVQSCCESQQPAGSSRRKQKSENDEGDNAATIAAGIAIGINGAAMGVAYLYETKSRAAPYAALSMTVFGVMTVVFTSVGPFMALLVAMTNAV